MPAVLRPNEYSAGAQKPIASPKGDGDDDEQRAIRSSGSFTSLFGISSLSRLSRRSTGDGGKFVDWDWDLANYPQVHGQPSRKHWKVRTVRQDTKPTHNLPHTRTHIHPSGKYYDNVSAFRHGVTPNMALFRDHFG